MLLQFYYFQVLQKSAFYNFIEENVHSMKDTLFVIKNGMFF